MIGEKDDDNCALNFRNDALALAWARQRLVSSQLNRLCDGVAQD